MAKKTKTLGAVSDINVTPMVDVMLVLLIIFMVITPMLQKGVSVDMAQVRESRATCRTPTRKTRWCWPSPGMGRSIWGPTPIQLDQITTKVKDRISNKLDKTVYVKSDARAKYGDVVTVVDNVRAAGVDSLGSADRKVERRTAGTAPEGLQ